MLGLRSAGALGVRGSRSAHSPSHARADFLSLSHTRHVRPRPLPFAPTWQIERLRLQLASVSRGEAFLLQGGDCAELFSYCTADKIEDRLSLLLSMSLILIWGMKKPVVRIARMGGQVSPPPATLSAILVVADEPRVAAARSTPNRARRRTRRTTGCRTLHFGART